MEKDNKQEQWSLKRDVQEIKQTTTEILRILHGPKDSSEASGLIFKVERNTAFRKWILAWLWILTMAMTYGIADKLLGYF